MAFEVKPNAASRVLNMPELVLLILPSLDKLSLVRSQGINRVFHDLFRNTSSLRGRIIKEGQIVLDTAQNEGLSQLLRWTPWLDWFITTAFLVGCPRYEGPIGEIQHFFACNILPHALRAAQNPGSMVYDMPITNPPVRSVGILIS